MFNFMRVTPLNYIINLIAYAAIGFVIGTHF